MPPPDSEYLFLQESSKFFPPDFPYTPRKEIIFPKKFFKKLKFIYCGINNGPGIARNKGVLFSKSEYILFLDCGDRSVSNRAKIQIKSLKKEANTDTVSVKEKEIAYERIDALEKEVIKKIEIKKYIVVKYNK